MLRMALSVSDPPWEEVLTTQAPSARGKVMRCANCGKRLKVSEVAANYNKEWFSCLPCWDKSDGFLGWAESLEAARKALE